VVRTDSLMGWTQPVFNGCGHQTLAMPNLQIEPHSRSQDTAANSGMLAYVPRIEQQGSNPSIHGFLSEPPAPLRPRRR